MKIFNLNQGGLKTPPKKVFPPKTQKAPPPPPPSHIMYTKPIG